MELWINENFQEGLFSVIMPTYNREEMILESLESVVSQSYRPIETIIIDDGSTDDTRRRVGEWIDRKIKVDTRLTFKYIYQDNSGVCSARNNALRQSSGEYIQFLDSDDLIHSQRLERLVNLFCETHCDYIETGFEGFLSDSHKVIQAHKGHVGQDQLSLLLQGKLWPNTLRPAYRRSLINRIGPWNETMITFQDYEYVIRALTLVPPPKTEAVEEILASARRDGGERMSDIFSTRKGRALRIHCEHILCEAVVGREDIPARYIADLASRLYGLAFRTNAKGWSDLGKECWDLAESLGADLDGLGKRRRLAAYSGRIGGVLYEMAGKIKRVLKRE